MTFSLFSSIYIIEQPCVPLWFCTQLCGFVYNKQMQPIITLSHMADKMYRIFYYYVQV